MRGVVQSLSVVNAGAGGASADAATRITAAVRLVRGDGSDPNLRDVVHLELPDDSAVRVRICARARAHLRAYANARACAHFRARVRMHARVCARTQKAQRYLSDTIGLLG